MSFFVHRSKLLLVLLPVKLLESHLAALNLHLCVVQQERLLPPVQQPFIDLGLELPSRESPKYIPKQGKFVGDLEVDQTQDPLLLKQETVVANPESVFIDYQVGMRSPDLHCFSNSHL